MKLPVRLRSWTIRARIALTILAASTGALLLMALAVYFGFRRSLLDNFDESLRVQAVSERKVVDTSGAEPRLSLSGPGDDLTTEDAGFVRLFDRSGRLVVGDEDFEPPPGERALIARGLAGQAGLGGIEVGGIDLRLYVSPVMKGDEVVGALVVGGRRDSVRRDLRSLRTLLLFAVPATSGLMAILAFYIARRTLKPIREITLAAGNIAEGDLSQRIEEGASHDEVDELATTFNHMIARLEETIERERRFTGDASHELRTPLTAIDAALEVTLSQERSAEQYRSVLVSLHKRTSQMIRMARQLLLLSRMDAQEVKKGFAPVQVAELLSAVLDAFSDEHPDTSVYAAGAEPALILGDSELLARAFRNILDNSAIHAPGAAIRVESGHIRDEVFVMFKDCGPGIPASQLPNVLRRFDRGGAPQERAGSGLGLAIVDSAVQVHSGRITIESSVEGTTVTLFFPDYADD